MHRTFTRLLALLAVATAVLGVAVTAQAKPVTPRKHIVVTSGSATITPTSTTATFITSHGITVTPIAPATLSSGTVTLPVIKGIATDRGLHGALRLGGGVTFAGAKRVVNVRDLTVVRTAKTWLWGKVNGHVIRLARLTDLKRTVTGNQATVTGAIRLTHRAAQAIDRLFGSHVVSTGYKLGTFSATLTFSK
jgi:hypothetical protein